MPRLCIIDGKLAGKSFKIGEKPVTVGRLPRCDIHLPETTISREHARLFVRQGRVQVADLNSANGTFVDGERITRSELAPGSTLRLGAISARLEVTVETSREVPAAARETAPGAARPTGASHAPGGPQAAGDSRADEPPRRDRPRPDGPGRPAASLRGSAERSPRGGVLSHDLAQHGGAWRLLAYGVSIAGAAALFYLVYRLVRGA